MKKTRQFALCLLILTACKTPQYKMQNQPIPTDFDWQGHRGARGLLPENTIPAFIKALDLGVRTLELDLAVSQDALLIVSHEPWLNADICSKKDGSPISKEESENQYLIWKMTAADISQCDCGSHGNPRFPTQKPMGISKPTLSEVVAAVKKYADFKRHPMPFWNIEIKSRPDWDEKRTPSVSNFADLVLKEIKRLGIESQTAIQSFDTRALEAVHKIAPSVKTVFLIENLVSLDKNLSKLTFTPNVYSPYYKLVNQDLVKKCHALNLKIIPWTVNEVSDMRQLIQLGVDGIITDYPDRIFWQ